MMIGSLGCVGWSYEESAPTDCWPPVPNPERAESSWPIMGCCSYRGCSSRNLSRYWGCPTGYSWSCSNPCASKKYHPVSLDNGMEPPVIKVKKFCFQVTSSKIHPQKLTPLTRIISMIEGCPESDQYPTLATQCVWLPKLFDKPEHNHVHDRFTKDYTEESCTHQKHILLKYCPGYTIGQYVGLNLLAVWKLNELLTH